MGSLKKTIRSLLNRPSGQSERGFKQVFSEFSRSLSLIVDPEQLKDNVIANIRDIVRVGRIYIFLLNEDMNRFTLSEMRGDGGDSVRRGYFNPDDPLVRWFTVNRTFLIVPDKPEVMKFFSGREQEYLRETGIEYLFPLMAMNRITGLVGMSRKLDGTRLLDNERELLDALLGQAAIAFENAFLYRQQKARLIKMYRADRLATLGQLAAGAAHEIRNPLTSIRSTIQYLQKDIRDEPKKQLVSDMLDEVDRINEIIEGMLSISRPVKPQKERIDLRPLLEQTINLVSNTARKQDVGITLEYSARDTALTADPAQLKQVFLNVIMNGIEASRQGGEITVYVNEHERPAGMDTAVSRWFSIIFQDSGIGIEPEKLEQLFDPFFTTKQNGTGLGLSITYGIIRRHGGDIEIESRTVTEHPGNHGTWVTIWLPVR